MKFFENLNIYFSVRQTIPWLVFTILICILAYVYTRDMVLFFMFLILVVMTLIMFLINWTYLIKQNHEKLRARIALEKAGNLQNIRNELKKKKKHK